MLAHLLGFDDMRALQRSPLIGVIDLVEAKWTRTPTPAMARAMRELAPRFSARVRCTLVHPAKPGGATEDVALAPSVRAMGVERFFAG